MIKKTPAMIEREQATWNKWKDEGDGYYSLIGQFYGVVAYISLPKNHPCIGKSYDDLEPDVNGGLTFSEENVFGWDYDHYQNNSSPEIDIPNAINYFKKLLCTINYHQLPY